jgi:peptidoglycan/xylan/chitin deacetylase (PgdA/CDA1 family)
MPPPKNTIVMIFDDGIGSLWSTAFPLLKKYGMKAVCFIVSHLIEVSNERYPTFEEYRQGKAALSEIINRMP